jgi:hypothetical protein
MSANGMVRPCSCPASDESGKGLQRPTRQSVAAPLIFPDNSFHDRERGMRQSRELLLILALAIAMAFAGAAFADPASDKAGWEHELSRAVMAKVDYPKWS